MPQLDLSKGLPDAVPAAACCFAADVEVGTNGDDAKTAPVKLLARSSQPVDTWWWGRVVHDMEGMTLSKSRIPLDYCHDPEQVIGYANKFDTASGDLVASGALVPYSADPSDKATEVLYKSKNGIPYQASIFFDAPLVMEYVDQGASVEVNGQQFSGPGVVVREWTLRGIAICPYGVDGNTAAEMSKKFSVDRNVPVASVIRKESNMSVATKGAGMKKFTGANEEQIKKLGAACDSAKKMDDAEMDKKEEEEAEKVKDEKLAENDDYDEEKEERKDEDKDKGEKKMSDAQTDEQKKNKPVGKEDDEPAEGDPPYNGDDEEGNEPLKKREDNIGSGYAERKAEAKKFRAEFGDRADKYFADGLSLSQARVQFAKDMQEENKRLATELAAEKTKKKANRGEEEPVSFSSEDGAAGTVDSDPRHINLGADPNKGVRKFANIVDQQIKQLTGKK